MGGWLAKNGESIYGTRGGPVKPGPGFVTTRRGNTIYLHAFDNAAAEILLPKLPRKVVSAEILGGGAVELGETAESWSIPLPAALRRPIDTIVKITLDGSAMDLGVVDLPGEFRDPKASNVFQKQESYAAGMAFDGDPATRWATDTGTGECWLEAQLGKPGLIRGIEIDEAAEYSGRVEKFVVRVLRGGEGKKVAEGTKLGKFRADFDPIEAGGVCLEITKANEGPTIAELRVRR